MIQQRKWAWPKCMKTCLIFVYSEFRHFHIVILLQYIHVIISRLYQASNSEYRTHCLYLDLNGLLTRRNFGCIPGMLGSYTIPK